MWFSNTVCGEVQLNLCGKMFILLELFYDKFNIKDNSTIPNARKSRQLTVVCRGGTASCKSQLTN